MDELRRVTIPTVDVLSVLLDSTDPVWGLAVIKQSLRAAGTVYPVLDRLERSGWVTSWWEVDDGRSGPRRRLYELTAEGAVAAQRAVTKHTASRVVATPRAAEAL